MTTQQTTWTEFDGSDEQIAELESAKNGYLLRLDNNYETDILFGVDEEEIICTTHYWLIPADPLREMKIRWAMTGQPVWWRAKQSHRTNGVTFNPKWDNDRFEYAFTEFKD